MYYVNIFCDKNGITHYSTEEFSCFQDKITDEDTAFADACRLSLVCSDWLYVGTLTDNSETSNRIFHRLEGFHTALHTLELHHIPADDFAVAEVELMAEHLKAKGC